MKNFQHLIYLLIWSEAVIWSEAGLKLVQVELGQNIPVNCDLADSKNIYWYKLTQCSAPVPILCSTCDKGGTTYYNTHLKQTFSLLVNHALLIQNITEDELGDYYCVKRGELDFSNGTRLNTTRHTTETVNKTEQNDQQPPRTTPWPTLTLASALLNCLFIVPVIALLASHCKRSSKSSPDSKRQQHPDESRALYEEVNLPPSARRARLGQDNSLQPLVQL